MEAIVHVRKLIGFCCAAAVLSLGLTALDSSAETPLVSSNAPAKAPRKAGEASASTPEDPARLVREVVYNELHDHDTHGYWKYWIERHSSKGSRVDEQVETPDGPITRAQFSNGQPLSADAREEEDRRMDRLLSSHSEQAQHRKEYAEDEHRIGRILALLPDAFLYEPAQEQLMPEGPCYHLRFRPNPDYPAHSIESRIFHAMAGDLWVSVKSKRLVRLDGKLRENVDFGYGILGRLYKDGWFRLERTHVSLGGNGGLGDWKTQRLEVHMIGRAILFKTIAHETSEVRGGFTPVPADLSLQQAATLIRQPINTPTARSAALVTSR
jgi:hypothetical protein